MPTPEPIALTQGRRPVSFVPRDIYMITGGSHNHTAFSDVLVRNDTAGRTIRVRETSQQIRERAPNEDWVNLTDDSGLSHDVNFSAVTDVVRHAGPGSRFVELRFSSSCARYFRVNQALTERLDATPARTGAALED